MHQHIGIAGNEIDPRAIATQSMVRLKTAEIARVASVVQRCAEQAKLRRQPHGPCSFHVPPD
jgi:hypothetical protein